MRSTGLRRGPFDYLHNAERPVTMPPDQLDVLIENVRQRIADAERAVRRNVVMVHELEKENLALRRQLEAVQSRETLQLRIEP